MKLQTKFILVLVPLAAVAVFGLGVWTTNKTVAVFHAAAEMYLDTVLETFVGQDLDSRMRILINNELNRTPSFVKTYQKEAIQAAAAMKLRWNGRIHIFDFEGRPVSDSANLPASFQTGEWKSMVDSLAKGEIPSAKGHLGGFLYKAVSFRPWHWVISVVLDDSRVHTASNRIQYTALAGAAALALVMTGLLILFFHYFVSQPVGELRRAAADIASRKRVRMVEVDSRDELGLLARDIERMSLAISNYEQELVRWNEELESLVEERTEDLKASRAILTRAQEIAHVGAWQWDAASNTVSVSDEVCHILGRPAAEFTTDPDEIIGYFHPEDREDFYAARSKAYRDQGVYDIEYRIIRPDGEIRYIHQKGELLRDVKGRPDRLFGVVQDITDRRQAETERLERNRLEGVMEMAGAACHELNQPLQILFSEIDLLQMKIDRNDPLFAKLGRIEETLDRIQSITEKIQGITKYETRDYIGQVRIIDIEKASR